MASPRLLSWVRSIVTSAETAELVEHARRQLRAAGLVVPGPDDFAPGRFDPAKLVLVMGPSGRSGLDLERHLLRQGMPVEMADRDTVVVLVSMLDDESTMARLVAAVLESLRDPAGPARGVDAQVTGLAPQRLSPRDAFFSPH